MKRNKWLSPDGMIGSVFEKFCLESKIIRIELSRIFPNQKSVEMKSFCGKERLTNILQEVSDEKKIHIVT